MRKVKWGVLSTAKIGVEKVIPAMQQGKYCDIVAVASRNIQKAEQVAEKLDIPKTYGTYEGLMNDPEIDAVYIPVPNHIHVEWTKKCLEAGKHVLCEKPLALETKEVKELIKLRDKTGLKVAEAFMVKTHPQWFMVKTMIRNGDIGQLKYINGFFSYFLDNPDNIRYAYQSGGGGLWDIGVYPVTTSRFVLDQEPLSVAASINVHPDLHIDIDGSVIMQFDDGVKSTFSYSTMLSSYQRMQFFGTEGMLEIKIPFNAPNDKPCEILLNRGDVSGKSDHVFTVPVCDQYTVQGDVFSKAIIENRAVPVPLEDTLGNTKVIQAIFEASKSGKWISI